MTLSDQLRKLAANRTLRIGVPEAGPVLLAAGGAGTR